MRDAVEELRLAGVTSLFRGSGRRFRLRLLAAMAAAAETTLAHARAVVTEVEARFEAVRARRTLRLKSRRITDTEDTGDTGDTRNAGDDINCGNGRDGDEDRPGSGIGAGRDRGGAATVSADDGEGVEESQAAREEAGGGASAGPGAPTQVVAGILRAAGNLVEGPFRGFELRGLPGLLEGAAEGAVGAAANVTAATLALAAALADRLHLFSAAAATGTRADCGGGGGLGSGHGDGTTATAGGGGGGGMAGGGSGSGSFSTRGRGGTTAPSRLRPLRPPPANHLEPLLPFDGVQALIRELHAFAAGGRFAHETFVGGAALVLPRGAFVAVTSRHVIVGVATSAGGDWVGNESNGGCSGGGGMVVISWLVREALPLEDVIAVDAAAQVVIIRALPRRWGGVTSSSGGSGGGGGGGGSAGWGVGVEGVGGDGSYGGIGWASTEGGAGGSASTFLPNDPPPLTVLQPVAFIAGAASRLTSRMALGVSTVRAAAAGLMYTKTVGKRGRAGAPTTRMGVTCASGDEDSAAGAGAGAGSGVAGSASVSDAGGADDSCVREVALHFRDEVIAGRLRDDVAGATAAAAAGIVAAAAAAGTTRGGRSIVSF